MRKKFDELFNHIKRDGKDELLMYLETSGYFIAPCSSQYHLAEKGGLLEHSINVTELTLELAEFMNCFETDMTESIVIVGLFHDLGKGEYYKKPHYIENILKSGKRSESKPYTSNKDRLYVPHEVASIHILSKFIQLTEEETFAILYHNGLYTSTGYGLRGNERPLQTLLHFADMWCSRFIETEIDPIKVNFDMSTLFWTYFYRTIYINPHEFVCNYKIIYLVQSRVNELAIARP